MKSFCFSENVTEWPSVIARLTFHIFNWHVICVAVLTMYVCMLMFLKWGDSMQADEGTGWLMELLTDVQLQQYFLRIRDELNVTRLSHFDYVKTEDLEKIGMGRPGERPQASVLTRTQTHLCTLANGILAAVISEITTATHFEQVLKFTYNEWRCSHPLKKTLTTTTVQ